MSSSQGLTLGCVVTHNFDDQTEKSRGQVTDFQYMGGEILFEVTWNGGLTAWYNASELTVITTD